MVDGFTLLGFGVGSRFLEAFDGSLQERGVNPGRNFAVGRSGAVDEFGELAVGAFDDARVQRILLLKSLQISEAQARIKSVGAGLDRVFSAYRTFGHGHGLEGGVEEGNTQVVEFVLEIEASF